jgi:hypothetical protein
MLYLNPEGIYMNITQITWLFFLGAVVVGLGAATGVLCLQLRDACQREDKLLKNLQNLRQGLRNETRQAFLSVFGRGFLVNLQYANVFTSDCLLVEDASSGKEKLRIGFDWSGDTLKSVSATLAGATYQIPVTELNFLIDYAVRARAASAVHT